MGAQNHVAGVACNVSRRLSARRLVALLCKASVVVLPVVSVGCYAWTLDRDADGETIPELGGLDCDDDNADVNPQGTELCNGIDDDCDGDIDEPDAKDVRQWWEDQDEDGFGNEFAEPVLACDRPQGFAESHDDCDDLDPDYNPAAGDASCDAHDQDCDGTNDEDAPQFVWYADTDDDGYGDIDVPTVSCSLPDGYSPDSTDCDDTRDTVHPGGTEACDGLDNNCSGFVDEGNPLYDWHPDEDGDTWGDGRTTQTQCVGPDDTWVQDGTDCDDTDPLVNPGEDETPYNGENDDCDELTGDCDSDGDGYDDDGTYGGATCKGTDCDDSTGTIRPGLADTWYDGVDTDCDGWSDYDQDHDGFDSGAWGGTDCDDGDDAVSPGVAEIIYNGVDDDCDPDTGDCDDDGDGFDDDGQYGGAYCDGDDCDDADGAVNPDVAEVYYNGKNDDCDAVMVTVDCDQDTDGLWSESECGGTDCDDGEACPTDSTYETCLAAAEKLRPGVWEHNDGFDNDCDGNVDRILIPGDTTLAYVGADYRLEDYTANPLLAANLGDYDNSGDVDLLFGVPSWDYSGVKTDAGAVYIETGISGSATVGSGTSGSIVLTDPTKDDKAGYAVAGVWNVTGSAYRNQVLLGIPYYDPTSVSAPNPGAACLVTYDAYSASSSGPIPSGRCQVRFDGVAGDDHAGQAVAYAGDITADGRGDILIGAPGNGSGAGAVYLIMGRNSGPTGFSSPSYALTDITLGATVYKGTTSSTDAFGTAVAGIGDAGNASAYAYDDFVVGAPGAASSAGAVYYYRGGSSPPSSTPTTTFTGDSSGDAAGTSVAGVGDVDGDTWDDLVIGAPLYGTNDVGAAYLELAGGWSSSMDLATDYDARMVGSNAYDEVGRTVAAAGDVDGDGYDDFLVGAPLYWVGGTISDTGTAFLVFGAASPSMTGTPLEGDGSTDMAGSSLSGIGDWNADGYDDFIVSYGTTYAYLFLGKP